MRFVSYKNVNLRGGFAYSKQQLNRNVTLDAVYKRYTGKDLENNQLIEYRLKLDSNPEFTASVIVAYARATHRMNREVMCGCKTVFDVPPAYLSPKSYEDIIAHLL